MNISTTHISSPSTRLCKGQQQTLKPGHQIPLEAASATTPSISHWLKLLLKNGSF